MTPWRLVFVLGTLPIAAACAAPGVQYHGRSEPSLVRAGALGEVSALPSGYEKIGHVGARCELTQGTPPPKSARLVDVDCGEARLMAGIRERAAEVGGELLVARRCRSRVVDRDDEGVVLGVTCEADVARPSDDALGHRALVGSVLAEADAPRASEAWRIRVRFTPTPGAPARAARRAEDVREVPYMPVSHVRLGDVVTSCKHGCSEEGARLGLMAAAGRFGASDVVDLRCVAKGHGWMCSATAAGYEVDPMLDPRVR